MCIRDRNVHEGSGIGLSLVQRLVELHHGQITLVSEVGKGSTFSIYSPQDKSGYTAEELAESKGEMEEQLVKLRESGKEKGHRL